MKTWQICILSFSVLICGPSGSHARVWTDVTGRYSIDAKLIAFNDTTVVLQREDHELGAVPIDQLSAADREFLKSAEGELERSESLDRPQTWTLRDGTKLVGRVVDFIRKEITIQRRRGRIYVNDRPVANLPEFYQQLLPKVVTHFHQLPSADMASLKAWAVRQRGQPRQFTVDGVVLESENGDEFAIPYFVFSEADLHVLQPGWQDWLDAREDYERRSNHAFLLQSLAAARQRDAQVQREIALMTLNLQAVEAGLTSLWEVTLYPVAGNRQSPRWVVVPGRDSRQATANALAQNPGFVTGPIRRVAPR